MEKRPAILHGADVRVLMSYLEHEADPMMVMNMEYEIIATNAAYRTQFTRAGQPYLGRTCYAVSHGYSVPCDQAGEHCPLQQAFASGGSSRVLHVHHTPRGPEHVDVELRPILDTDGVVLGFVERFKTVRSAAATASKDGLVGTSAAFRHALEEVQRVAGSQLPVLLLGESGTGKELFARAVHAASARSNGPYVVVDCSGLTETLFESELFGYEKGAFTGANARKLGLVETAKGGTLFLDELGDIPLPMQVKLLRLLETGTYRRVGGLDNLTADFRLVAATHKPLQQMVARGEFREDLYYRISAFPVALPALRERIEDLPMLVETILQRSAMPGLKVAPATLARLQQHRWPGNIRELRNVIERAALFADDGIIQPEHLPPGLGETLPRAAPLATGEFADFVRSFGGSRKALAQALGLSERTLYRRLKAAGLA